jgi:hypothetical protein
LLRPHHPHFLPPFSSPFNYESISGLMYWLRALMFQSLLKSPTTEHCIEDQALSTWVFLEDIHIQAIIGTMFNLKYV